jgi:hypothetical protein
MYFVHIVKNIYHMAGARSHCPAKTENRTVQFTPAGLELPVFICLV